MNRQAVRFRWSRGVALVASHLVAVALGVTVATIAKHRLLATSAPLGDALERLPLSRAATFAYRWGSNDDAQALLSQYIHDIKSDSASDEGLRQKDLALAQIRLGILNQAPPEQMLKFCAVLSPKCSPTSIESVVARLSRQRRVSERSETRAPNSALHQTGPSLRSGPAGER